MRLLDFSYDLPDSLIAQEPLPERTGSRLMVVDRSSGARRHEVFADAFRFMGNGDVLVVNRSRVVPARLFCKRATGGEVEVLFVGKLGEGAFRALLRPAGKIRIGETVEGANGRFSLRMMRRIAAREAELETAAGGGIDDILRDFGHVPLPPYISRPDRPGDRERYQTVYARENGSVAAPTAGLHFNETLLETLEAGGVQVLSVVLHVGPGTFLPLDEETVERNSRPAEACCIDGRAAAGLRRAKAEGRRIVAVGTTVTRVLESAYRSGHIQALGEHEEFCGETDLFIYPGFEFKVVDGLFTNFHLPRSSLLLLVSAFLGREKTLECYEEAVQRRYRFYSYGDAMLIR
ncbi:MAG: tRNA preQ1(34) S-adenosylmethionine ribosyltransferase-isomerase QueA [Chitinivibrionia bacterium]|nr:tRNA preQ1(34) S-adenosylmethionine ribosyltransferase-isomerase QueA [Chitinivibrionia bacterium]